MANDVEKLPDKGKKLTYFRLDATFKELFASHALTSAADWLQFSERKIVASRTSWTHFLRFPPPLPNCYGKCYFYPTFRNQRNILLRGGFLGKSRARKEFENLMFLHQIGLSPCPIAFAERRRFGFLQESLLIVAEVTDATPLDAFISTQLADLSTAERHAFIIALAEFTQRMNLSGFLNTEFHWRNILVRASGDNFHFQVIDPSARRWRHRWLYPYFDLATLDVAAPHFFRASERLLFFKVYHGYSKAPLTKSQKKLIRKILRLRQQILPKEEPRYQSFLPKQKLPE